MSMELRILRKGNNHPTMPGFIDVLQWRIRLPRPMSFGLAVSDWMDVPVVYEPAELSKSNVEPSND